VSGLTELREVAHRSAIALEVGRDDATLLAFRCLDAPPVANPLHEPLRSRRACYRCVLTVVGQSPVDPYGPDPRDGALRSVAAALRRYPDRFLAVANVDRLALCDSLEDDTHAEDQTISGLADQDERRLLIGLGPQDLSRAADILHHEVFHLFDHGTGEFAVDPAWERLNPPGFRYHPQAESEVAGFLDRYAQTNVVEDKATVFQYMMTRGDEFCARAAVDPIVLAKGRLLRHRIARETSPRDAGFVDRSVRCL